MMVKQTEIYTILLFLLSIIIAIVFDLNLNSSMVDSAIAKNDNDAVGSSYVIIEPKMQVISRENTVRWIVSEQDIIVNDNSYTMERNYKNNFCYIYNKDEIVSIVGNNMCGDDLRRLKRYLIQDNIFNMKEEKVKNDNNRVKLSTFVIEDNVFTMKEEK